MSRDDFERWAREWWVTAGAVSEMPVGSLLTQVKVLQKEGRTVHFFQPVWPGDDDRPRLGIMAAVMTNYTDLCVMATTAVGPDAWTRAPSLDAFCRAAWAPCSIDI
jgi:hypothetical protein